jgi:hypothetical protein
MSFRPQGEIRFSIEVRTLYLSEVVLERFLASLEMTIHFFCGFVKITEQAKNIYAF